MYLNLAIIIYIGFSQPFTSRLKNRLEYINEAMVGIITFQFIFCTDWVDSEEFKFELGWILVISVLVLIVINLAFVFYYAFR